MRSSVNEHIELIRFIQNCIANVPTIVIGSGASMAYGMPGMPQLADYLLENIHPLEDEMEAWKQFEGCLKGGLGLEAALHEVPITERLHKDIILLTRNLILVKDLEIRNQILNKEINLPLSELLNFMNTAASPNAKVITTNYDRLVEYAIDYAKLEQHLGFEGNYIKWFNPLGNMNTTLKNKVEVLKVHGSLDWFVTRQDEIISLPDGSEGYYNVEPVMITPGKAKYQHTHDEPFRTLITKVDKIFDESKAIVIIGFGFNDNHIQPKLFAKMRDSKTPILILSKTLTREAKSFVYGNEKGKVIGIEENGTGSKIIKSDRSEIDVAERLWNLEDLLKIIL